MKRAITCILAAAVIMSFGPVSAAAATTSNFEAESNYDFYDSTLYEDVYGSGYNYGGQNVTDFYDTSKLPGLISPTPETSALGRGVTVFETSADTPAVFYPKSEGNFIEYSTAFTPVSEVVHADGSIGSLSIPALSISMKVYEGTSAQSMNKGAGHFPDTSAWNGNIGLCGHNRNAKYTIGSIKDLKIGDTVKYTTGFGTRTYSVSYVGMISDIDWSHLTPSSDNRITLITCLADQPSLRVCVVAVEKN
jgi:LPXTG-site transpeptidase (sortase) family protein